jgi:hypothetical protein
VPGARSTRNRTTFWPARGPPGASVPPARHSVMVRAPFSEVVHRRAEAHPPLRRAARERHRQARSSSSAGCRTGAITAAASSSICATATASRRSCSTPTYTPSNPARRAGRRLGAEWVVGIREAHGSPCVRGEWVVGVRGVVVSRGIQREPEAPHGRGRGARARGDRLQPRRDAALRDHRRHRDREEKRLSTATSTCAGRRCSARSHARTKMNRVTRNYLSEPRASSSSRRPSW